MTAEEFKKIKPEYKNIEGDQLWNAMEKERIENIKEANRVRKIWDKYYSKYGLECRELACNEYKF